MNVLVFVLMVVMTAQALTSSKHIPFSFTSSTRLAMVSSDTGPSDVAKEIIEKQFKVGKSVQWGVLQADVDEAKVPDDNTRATLRDVASRELVNIDDKERARRTLVGKASGLLTVLSFAASLHYHLDIIPRTIAIYLPLSLSLGFLESGKQGL